MDMGGLVWHFFRPEQVATVSGAWSGFRLHLEIREAASNALVTRKKNCFKNDHLDQFDANCMRGSLARILRAAVPTKCLLVLRLQR